MLKCNDIASLKLAIKNIKLSGKSIAFVPTMGNLHSGHLSLLKTARQHADIVVASIFVNPLQFSPDEDFEQYPRTLDSDLKKLEQQQCDLVFLPEQHSILPKDFNSQTQIRVSPLRDDLEGTAREGHLDGVATIVTKLFNLVQPDTACFGKKDYQQWLMIKKMVADLDMDINIIGCETIREDDGLALSSRNQYLSAEHRAIAPLLHQTLVHCSQQIQNNNKPYACIKEAVQQLQQQGFKVDYLELRQQQTLKPTHHHSNSVLICAARLAHTRLLDNIEIS